MELSGPHLHYRYDVTINGEERRIELMGEYHERPLKLTRERLIPIDYIKREAKIYGMEEVRIHLEMIPFSFVSNTGELIGRGYRLNRGYSMDGKSFYDSRSIDALYMSAKFEGFDVSCCDIRPDDLIEMYDHSHDFNKSLMSSYWWPRKSYGHNPGYVDISGILKEYDPSSSILSGVMKRNLHNINRIYSLQIVSECLFIPYQTEENPWGMTRERMNKIQGKGWEENKERGFCLFLDRLREGLHSSALMDDPEKALLSFARAIHSVDRPNEMDIMGVGMCADLYFVSRLLRTKSCKCRSCVISRQTNVMDPKDQYLDGGKFHITQTGGFHTEIISSILSSFFGEVIIPESIRDDRGRIILSRAESAIFTEKTPTFAKDYDRYINKYYCLCARMSIIPHTGNKFNEDLPDIVSAWNLLVGENSLLNVETSEFIATQLIISATALSILFPYFFRFHISVEGDRMIVYQIHKGVIFLESKSKKKSAGMGGNKIDYSPHQIRIMNEISASLTYKKRRGKAICLRTELPILPTIIQIDEDEITGERDLRDIEEGFTRGEIDDKCDMISKAGEMLLDSQQKGIRSDHLLPLMRDFMGLLDIYESDDEIEREK